MKIMCISDIHGNIECLEKAIEKFEEEDAEKLIILGDFSSYYFSSSDFEVAEILNNMAGSIIAVKGNCDSDVDQMVLQFPIIAPLIIMEIKNRNIYFTHGDIFNSNHLPPMNKNDILVHGHTHVVRKEVHPDHIYLNPGSISLPKENCYHGYMLLDEDCFYYYDENHQIKDVYKID